MHRRLTVCILGLACVGCAAAQDATTTLRVTSRVVAISAVVKEKDGTALTDLAKESFTLKQDGREQAIRYFSSAEELPLTFALMVDVSGSQRTLIGDESIAADVFLRTMLQRPQDRAALLQFDAAVTELRTMTSDPNALHLAMTALGARRETANATLLNDAVFAVSDKVLAKEKGRKAVVLLTDGVDAGSAHSLRDAVEEAQRNNVQVYSIYYGAWSGFSSPGGRTPAPSDGRDVLKKLSQQTGGRAFEVSASMGLHTIFQRIAEDLRTQYELGYVPPADTAPGKWHRLEIRVKERGATVQARDAFFADP